MRARWFVLGFVLIVIFPLQSVAVCQSVAQALISGADSAVDAPAPGTATPGGDLDG